MFIRASRRWICRDVVPHLLTNLQGTCSANAQRRTQAGTPAGRLHTLTVMLSQASSLIHMGEGLLGCWERSSTVPPRRKNCHSSRLIWAATNITQANTQVTDREPVVDPSLL